jgi:hypothetical protein
MRYYLGVALVKTKSRAGQARARAGAGRTGGQTGAVDARFWLATALEGMGEIAPAPSTIASRPAYRPLRWRRGKAMALAAGRAHQLRYACRVGAPCHRRRAVRGGDRTLDDATFAAMAGS